MSVIFLRILLFLIFLINLKFSDEHGGGKPPSKLNTSPPPKNKANAPAFHQVTTPPTPPGDFQSTAAAKKGGPAAARLEPGYDDRENLAAGTKTNNNNKQQHRPGKSNASPLMSATMQAFSTASAANQQLVRKLYLTYVKEAVAHKPCVIHIDLLLLHIKSTIEKDGVFQSRIAIFMEWQDPRLIWDPSEHNNISVLMFDAEQIWLPDLAMTNSAENIHSITTDSRFVVRVTHTGLLKYVPTGEAKTWCDLNLQTFPFDIQNCSILIESWSYQKDIVTFDGKSRILLSPNYTSPLWKLCYFGTKQYEHTRSHTEDVHVRVRFEFIIQRKSTFYVVSLIFPCLILSAVQLMVFLISVTDTTADRIGFGTTNLLTLIVFLTTVTVEMPRTSDAVTAISRYIITLIITSALSIVESVVVEKLINRHNNEPPPPVIARMAIIIAKVSIFVRCRRHAKVFREIDEATITDKNVIDHHQPPNNNDDNNQDDKEQQDHHHQNSLFHLHEPLPEHYEYTFPTVPPVTHFRRRNHYRRYHYDSELSSCIEEEDDMTPSASKIIDYRHQQPLARSRRCNFALLATNSELGHQHPVQFHHQHLYHHQTQQPPSSSTNKIPLSEVVEQIEQTGKMIPGMSWKIIAYEIDVAAFVICAALAIAAPTVFFLYPFTHLSSILEDDQQPHADPCRGLEL